MRGVSFSENLAQLRDVDGEIGLFDEGIRPNPAQQHLFLHELATVLKENREQIDGSAGQGNKLPIAKKEMLAAVEMKGTKLPVHLIGPRHGTPGFRRY
ncbi:MAG TPA: hypothetical protein VMD92_01010 [Acidobacteriaceae bacterium]|nr:hypothetical protein [Acidobacteriaceae bacterium]